MGHTPRIWHAGSRVLVRGHVWSLVERCSYIDCESLRLRPESVRNRGCRTILLPFDRPKPLPRGGEFRVVPPGTWIRVIRGFAAALTPAGGFTAAGDSRVTILPYQLEPALLMRRDGVTRVMIADGVGLGKTIQASLLLNELASEHSEIRALVIVPAGLRDQWVRQLATHFRLPSIDAGSRWLARAASELPIDVNPWALPGIYVASCDLIKRPEVLRPLEEVTWDAVVVDEAHQAALGTARRAAVHAVASRARRVILLTATPHAGDAEQFNAMCRLGATDSDAPQIVMFRRRRSEVMPHLTRRRRVAAVRLTPAERCMHRRLEDYTARLCREAHARSDQHVRLVAVVLRKRALSSAGSLASSILRRLELLAGRADSGEAFQFQPSLPLEDEDALADAEPGSVLRTPGLANPREERRVLGKILRAARRARLCESKTRFLRRLLGRLREPAIVFTEYRDTLERLRRELSAVQPNLLVLHGGMDLRERACAQEAFNTRSSLLLTTDAAAEGLNLHERCRIVIHFELPWSPARLEQRAGRVDRIGQATRVHELLLVARDTAERLVLAPLVERMTRSQSLLGDNAFLVDAVTESQVAAAVLDRQPVRAMAPETVAAGFSDPPPGLREEAAREAERLMELRRHAISRSPTSVVVTFIERSRHVDPGVFAVYEISLETPDGNRPHREIAVARCAIDAEAHGGQAQHPVRLLSTLPTAIDEHIRGVLLQHCGAQLSEIAMRYRQAAERLAGREQAILRALPSAARQLVQPGLFDQRTVRTLSARKRVATLLLNDANNYLKRLSSSAHLQPSARLCAVLVAHAENTE
jgi:superfamily II DNA or RNA helicase